MMAEDNMTPSEAGELLKKMKAIASDLWREPPEEPEDRAPKQAQQPAKPVKKNGAGIDNLWMIADETVDWTDALAHDRPADGLTSQKMWDFYHRNAEAVLSGDLQAYAEVLKRANPLGELTEFADGISIRVPDADRAEARFNVKEDYMKKDGKKYLSAMGLRIARDLLACLPVGEIGVAAVREGQAVLEVTYRRDQLLHRNFSFLDPVALAAECEAQFNIE